MAFICCIKTSFEILSHSVSRIVKTLIEISFDQVVVTACFFFFVFFFWGGCIFLIFTRQKLMKTCRKNSNSSVVMDVKVHVSLFLFSCFFCRRQMKGGIWPRYMCIWLMQFYFGGLVNTSIFLSPLPMFCLLSLQQDLQISRESHAVQPKTGSVSTTSRSSMRSEQLTDDNSSISAKSDVSVDSLIFDANFGT